MDKAAYCEEMAGRLRGVAHFLETLRLPPPPSTLEAAKRQAERQAGARRLKMLNAEAVAALEALCASADPAWESAKQEIDRRWQEVVDLKKKVE